jgi:hypothetical protein
MYQDIMKTQTIGAALVRKHTVTEAEKKGTEVRIRYFIEFVVSVNSVFGYVFIFAHLWNTNSVYRTFYRYLNAKITEFACNQGSIKRFYENIIGSLTPPKL